MGTPLKVGIIGASAERGWAKISHVPAVQGLEGLELAAVATHNQRSADAAAKAFGVTGYADATAVFQDQAIDIVAVAVNVPAHRALVLGALEAGKHLYCEWPLGRTLAEAEELAAAAQTAGIHAVIGLQTRQNPAARAARELLGRGAIGRVLSANVLSTAMAFGPEVEQPMAFAEKVENGTTLVSIQGGHTIDLAIALLGELGDLVALATTQYPEVKVGDDPAPKPRPTPDHILVQARLASGAPLTVEVAGGRPPEDTPFRFEVIGERGSLVLHGGAPRGFQSGRLRLLLNGEEQKVDEGEVAGMIDTAANVAGVYARLREDINKQSSTAPGFDHAVRLTRLIDDVLESSRTGVRRQATDWPRP
jgi:predicted dehydrogenase